MGETFSGFYKKRYEVTFASKKLAYGGTCLGSALRGRWRPVYSLLEDYVVGWAQVGELEETGGFGKKWLYW